MPAIDRRILAAALLIVSTATASQRARAQEAPSQSGGGGAAPSAVVADSLPFRAGQWGADFAINNGAVGLGVLRFRSPRMAWTLDASIGADWRDTKVSGSISDTPFVQDGDANSLTFGLRTGPRWYHPITAGVATYIGTGITSQIVRSRSDPTVSESRGWNVGGFGDVGAAYFVTRRLSLGAQSGVYLTYGKSTNRTELPVIERKEQTTRVGVTAVRILGALYF